MGFVRPKCTTLILGAPCYYGPQNGPQVHLHHYAWFYSRALCRRTRLPVATLCLSNLALECAVLRAVPDRPELRPPRWRQRRWGCQGEVMGAELLRTAASHGTRAACSSLVIAADCLSTLPSPSPQAVCAGGGQEGDNCDPASNCACANGFGCVETSAGDYACRVSMLRALTIWEGNRISIRGGVPGAAQATALCQPPTVWLQANCQATFALDQQGAANLCYDASIPLARCFSAGGFSIPAFDESACTLTSVCRISGNRGYCKVRHPHEQLAGCRAIQCFACPPCLHRTTHLQTPSTPLSDPALAGHLRSRRPLPRRQQSREHLLWLRSLWLSGWHMHCQPQQWCRHLCGTSTSTVVPILWLPGFRSQRVGVPAG